MDDTSGFYKLAEGGLLFAGNFVHAPGFSLFRYDPDSKLGDHGGWQWFDSDALAYAHHSITPATPASTSISPLQARLALLAAGLLDQVEDIVASGDRSTQIAWNNATEFFPDSPLLLGMAQAIGLSQLELEDLFTYARTIRV